MKKTKQARKFKRRLGLVVALSGAAFIAIDSAIAIAAYFAISYDAFNISTTTPNIGTTYFSSGTGSASDPYIIKTPDHLRNLQKLNALGLFSPDTNFRIDTDSWQNDTITWSGDPLLPIGSDDEPFEGVFDGNGKTITNLVVDGYNTWDIGMFGYVAITGTIKNFFLDHPTIYVGANSDGGSADTTNPLNGLKSAAQALAVPAARGSSTGLSWTNGTSSSTLTGLDSTISGTVGGQLTTFSIQWESSSTALLSYNTATSSWVTHATSASTSPTTDVYPVMLTGRIFAEVNGRIAPYTLERYEISVLGNGLISDGTVSISGGQTTAMKGIFKTIWPLSANNDQADYHGIYVGFFVGHLDGSAAYLGLVGGNSLDTTKNGIISVSGRLAQSTTTLIGRCRGDNVRDGTGSNQFAHSYDFTKSVSGWANYGDFIEAGSDNNYQAPGYYEDDPYTTTMNNMRTLTSWYDYGQYYSDAYTYCRIYPSAAYQSNLETQYPTAFSGVSGIHAINFSSGLAASCRTSPTYSLSTSNAYRIGKYNYTTDPTNYNYNFNVIDKYAISNGFWIYARGDEADLINTIVGETSFTINFRITYLADPSMGQNNAWQILYNAYNYDRTNNARIKTTQYGLIRNSSSYYTTYSDSFYQNCLWYDLHKPYVYDATLATPDYTRLRDTNGNSISYYDPVPIIADGKVHEATATITVNRTGSDFWNAYYDSLISSGTWYPCFALGIGRLDQGDADTVIQRNTNYSIWQGPLKSAPTSPAQRGHNYAYGSEQTQYFNSYFPVDGTVNVNILSFQSVFTNAYGNVANTMKNVDYIYSKSACSFDSTNKTFSAWNNASGVKVGFNVTAALTGSNATYYFYRDAGQSGADAKVHGLYSNSTYALTNDVNYTAATLGAYSA